MNEASHLQIIMSLFAARKDTYSLHNENGDHYRQKNPLTESIIQQHLAGRKTIGVYQLGEHDLCIWGCYDSDIGKKKEIKKLTDDEISTRLDASLGEIKRLQAHLSIFCTSAPADVLREFTGSVRNGNVSSIL
jgi:hypothetical protein